MERTDVAMADALAGAFLSDASESYHEAVYLARRGRFRRARETLAHALANGACTPVQADDLNARMCAQEGRPLDADEAWRRAQEADPANPAYAAGRAYLRAVHFHRIGPRWLAAGLFAALGLLVILVEVQHAADQRHQVEIQHMVANLADQVQASRSAMSAQAASSEAHLHAAIGEVAGMAGQRELLRQTAALGDELTRLEKAAAGRADATNGAMTALNRRLDETRDQIAAIPQSVETGWREDAQGLATAKEVADLTQRTQELATSVVALERELDAASNSLRDQLGPLARADDTAKVAADLTQLDSRVVDLNRTIQTIEHEMHALSERPASGSGATPHTVPPRALP